jgi:hypothetical protein
VGVIRDPGKNEILRLVPGEYKVNPAE